MKLTRENVPFTMVANEVLASSSISLKAKGLYAYLFSKPDGWDYSADRIQRECKEERKAILRSLKELEDAGLLSRKKHPNGRVEYSLKYSMKGEVPKSRNGTVAKRHGGEVVPISKKDSDNNTEKESNTGDAGRRKFSSLGADIIKEMESVDPKNKMYYNNTSQRAAADFLVEEYGLEEVKKRVSVLPRTNKLPYFPTITTPVQLRDKWVQLQDAVERFKARGTEKETKVAFT